MDLRPYIGIGTVTYDKQRLDPEERVIDQLHELDEDLVRIEYPGGYLIDLGWEVDFARGDFSLMVVLNDDRERLPLEVAFRRVRFLPGLLRLCSTFVEGLVTGIGEEDLPSDFRACVGDGSITYKKETLDLGKGLADQVGEMTESLLIADYPKGYAVDLWWDPCPRYEELSKYVLLLVRDGDWDCPLATLTFNDARHASTLLQLCSELVWSMC